jgi:hypothetical protein
VSEREGVTKVTKITDLTKDRVYTLQAKRIKVCTSSQGMMAIPKVVVQVQMIFRFGLAK